MAVLESFANFLLSIICVYPKFDWSTSWLVNRELVRVEYELSSLEKAKISEINKADLMVTQAKKISNDIWDKDNG